jgi:hypothetical protein
MITTRSVRLLALAVILLCAALESFGEEKRTFILATGRRDPRIYAIDLHKALQPANNNTSNAIVSRALVNPRRLDGTPLGDPAKRLKKARLQSRVLTH